MDADPFRVSLLSCSRCWPDIVDKRRLLIGWEIALTVLAVDRSGALLIADDVGNTVWRVSADRSTTALK
jgi:hypothetical protein